MRRPVLFSAALSFAALPVAALAGGLSEPVATPVVVAPPAVTVAPPMARGDWTGGFVGAQLSWGQITSDALDSATEDELKGLTYGVSAGYDRQFGRFVLGGEAAYEWSSIGYEAEDAAGDTVNVLSLDNVLRAGVRAGFDGGRVLPYLTGGYTRAETSSEAGGFEGTLQGYYFGLGLDYRVSDRVTVGAQALRHEFDQFEGEDLDENLRADTLQLRASFRF